MKFQFIDHHQGVFPIRCMCETLEVSPSGFYAWRNRPQCRRKRKDRRLVWEIKAIHRENRGAYGSPRIHAELKHRQMRHDRKRIARLMRGNGIRAKQKKKFKATTDSKHSHPVAPNLLQRNFEADMPDRKWLVLEALAMAVEHRRPRPGPIHHPDRGSQYACGDYQRALRSHGMICSMSRKGDCRDNAPVGSFFHTLKTELVQHRNYQTRGQAKADIF